MFSTLNIYVRRTFNAEYLMQMKNYGRWTHRRPNRILLPGTQEDTLIKNSQVNHEHLIEENNTSIQWRHADTKEKVDIVKRVNRNTVKEATYDMLDTIIDANGELVYTKLPNKDTRVTSLLTLAQSNSSKEKKSILLEGKRLIIEALQSNCKLEYVLFSRKDHIEHLKPFLPKSGAKLYKIPYREIQLWSDLTTCPGIMGIFRKPDVSNFKPVPDSVPITVVCDNVREPGNLGSILRTCAGVGCQNVILTKGCANLWDSKVIRSSCGAHFQLQIYTKLDWTKIEEQLQSNSKVFIADNKIISSSNEIPEETAFRIQNIPLAPYYGIHIDKTDPVMLIIGGETEGLSEDAYKLVYNFKGIRLNVPLTKAIDSLNSGVALGIILFEMKKQMLLNISERNKIHNTG